MPAAKKVLVVDDSALMRRVLTRMLEEGGFEVVTAHDGAHALEVLARENPDVVTLDVNMPRMDGLTCLSRIMSDCPKPVVMCSSITQEGAAATLEALALGAVDIILKPDGTVSPSLYRIEDEIVAKVRAAASARPRKSRAGGGVQRPVGPERRAVPRGATGAPPPLEYLVLVGVSTGGPGMLDDVLSELPADLPGAVVIAQHMPAGFTQTLAQRLDRTCPLPVSEVSAVTEIKAANVYLGRGGSDLVVTRRGAGIALSPVPADPKRLWHPSVSRLVASALEHTEAAHLVGVQLTGMGNDGAAEMAELRRLGGRTIAESEETAVVFGMPKELIDLGGATSVLPSSRIGREIGRWTALTPTQAA
ncbi:chemotaxis-specific protein-glutamate methyltransferase CheB [uncultured Aureimonas sp.]|uniref:chemotaxis-specific protein-glutamate methyltransferase CheB n=1 Tax=uncultured Aureimonas sp. TaxID=1604662 RepID=UPI0025FC7F34|nr:chemotaxis-specific protein-glutamate methyltransferase CheB [uncultured Aureimonas sp.]